MMQPHLFVQFPNIEVFNADLGSPFDDGPVCASILESHDWAPLGLH